MYVSRKEGHFQQIQMISVFSSNKSSVLTTAFWSFFMELNNVCSIISALFVWRREAWTFSKISPSVPKENALVNYNNDTKKKS